MKTRFEHVTDSPTKNPFTRHVSIPSFTGAILSIFLPILPTNEVKVTNVFFSVVTGSDEMHAQVPRDLNRSVHRYPEGHDDLLSLQLSLIEWTRRHAVARCIQPTGKRKADHPHNGKNELLIPVIISLRLAGCLLSTGTFLYISIGRLGVLNTHLRLSFFCQREER